MAVWKEKDGCSAFPVSAASSYVALNMYTPRHSEMKMVPVCDRGVRLPSLSCLGSRDGTETDVVIIDDVEVEGGDESRVVGHHQLAHHVPRRELEHPRPSHDGPVRLPGRVHPPDHRERAVAEAPRREHQHQRYQRRLVPLRHVEAHALRPPDFSRPLGGAGPQHGVEDVDVPEGVGEAHVHHGDGGVVGAEKGLVEVDAEVDSALPAEFELGGDREGRGSGQEEEEDEEEVEMRGAVWGWSHGSDDKRIEVRSAQRWMRHVCL
ncbi:hypothetical protein MUK42_33564 [Musa troglodytarum]|uniref:Uncharacterized protein n=1 Tax=Musa troglodytarum TaxID=320322 RepID=A0A9E7I890_9LILI|nr:hypothetical protein MUK42_33564 [Musa troglodytarum]